MKRDSSNRPGSARIMVTVGTPIRDHGQTQSGVQAHQKGVSPDGRAALEHPRTVSETAG
jgi:hypothetical protein